MKEELIKITTNEEGKQLVSGRELHEFLEIKTKYKDWFPRMVEYGFEEGIDFVKVAQKRATNNLKNPVTTIIDHAISIDMAKELSMIQRTDKGKQARLYFIECEKKLKEVDKKANLLLAIYNGGEGGLEASKKLLVLEAAPIKAELKEANIQLQKDKEWWAIKRVAIITNTSWKDYSWKKLKAASEKTNHEVKKVFDANFGSVNAYHEDAWKEVYPDIYKEIMK